MPNSILKWASSHEPISKITGANVKSHVESIVTKQSLADLLEELAEFVDKHDIIIPEMKLKVKGIELSLSGKKLEDEDASKRIEEAKRFEDEKTNPD